MLRNIQWKFETDSVALHRERTAMAYAGDRNVLHEIAIDGHSCSRPNKKLQHNPEKLHYTN